MAEISGMCVLKWSIDLMNDGEAYEGDLDKKKWNFWIDVILSCWNFSEFFIEDSCENS